MAMSEIRTSAESNIANDEETTEDADAFRQVDNTKREKLASFSDTTLQDIPIEILQCILVKAIVMEVRNMKLAKSVWKEKADLEISRLGSVGSQWSSVLTTDFFRLELHRAQDGIAQQKIRLEIVQESFVAQCFTLGIAALKDDIFLLYGNGNTSEIFSTYNITVHDRNNMAEVKDVIELPGQYNGEIAACNVSNCIYYFCGVKENIESNHESVLRITKDEYQKFNIEPWVSDLRWSVYSISVTDEGRLLILWSTLGDLSPNVVSVYYPNGFLHHEVVLPQKVDGLRCIDSHVIRKPNENLVLASVREQSEIHVHVDLTEIDTNGIIQRTYESSLEHTNHMIFMSFVDAFGRILIHDMVNGMELLDSEFNLLEFTGPQSDEDDDLLFDALHFNRERNEVIGICAVNVNLSIIKIFRFIEE